MKSGFKLGSWQRITVIIIIAGLVLVAFSTLAMKVLLIDGDSPKQSYTTSIAKWKTFDNYKFSISYPPSWKSKRTHTYSYAVLELISQDYKSMDYREYPAAGFTVSLYIGRLLNQDHSPGLVSTRNVRWLEEKAVLSIYKYEGSFLVLTAKPKDTPYQMVMTASSDQVRDDNEKLFLQVANTLRPK